MFYSPYITLTIFNINSPKATIEQIELHEEKKKKPEEGNIGLADYYKKEIEVKKRDKERKGEDD